MGPWRDSENTKRAVQVARDLRSGQLARVRHHFHTDAAVTAAARASATPSASSCSASAGTAAAISFVSPSTVASAAAAAAAVAAAEVAPRRVRVPLFTLRRPMRIGEMRVLNLFEPR